MCIHLYLTRNGLTTCLILLILCITGPRAFSFAGGTGTPEDPYLVSTPSHLLALNTSDDTQNAHFALVADIDLDPSLPGGRVFEGAVIESVFSGSLDGRGHSILNLTISAPEKHYVGLFRFLTSGHLLNLRLMNCYVVGGLHTAGLVAYSTQGTINGCFVEGEVTGEYNVGLLLGQMWGGEVRCSASAGLATAAHRVGGLVGYVTPNPGRSPTYETCVVTSTSSANVTGEFNAGGLVGWNRAKIFDCYATGEVEGVQRIGGLAGYNQGLIESSYATGQVRGMESAGGFAGANEGIIWRCFWDREMSATTSRSSAGGEGATTAMMQQAALFSSWNLPGQVNWTIDEGKTHPRLIWEKAPGQPITSELNEGVGTEDDPILVSTERQLLYLGQASLLWASPFRLTADLDCQTFDDGDLSGIGTRRLIYIRIPFSGHFDGGGHRIANLTVEGSAEGYGGMFVELGETAEIRDLGLVNIRVNARQSAGGLAAINRGTVHGCYVTGTVLSDASAGGLIGSNTETAFVQSCYSEAQISTPWFAGGLIGANAGDVIHCYASGAVKGERGAGGLAGINTGLILNAYWDTETSGLAESAGGEGKNTDAMHRPETFVGWHGLSPGWTIEPGQDYPRLWWEGRPGQALPTLNLSDVLPGAGTQDMPFLVATAEDLSLIGLFPQAWDSHFLVTADLDFDETPGATYRQIGLQQELPFAGIFDGQGHRLLNLDLETQAQSPIALFGGIGASGRVQGLHFVDVNVIGEGQAASLVIRNKGSITDCNVSGTIVGDHIVGGLAAINEGRIQHCDVWGEVRGSETVGGVVGSCPSRKSQVEACSFSGTLVGRQNGGGLVGENRGTILRSSTRGEVRGPVPDEGWGLGGVVGTNMGVINSVYSSAMVSGRATLAGLAANNYGHILNSYCKGLIAESHFGLIAYCYSESTGDTQLIGGATRGYQGTLLSSFVHDLPLLPHVQEPSPPDRSNTRGIRLLDVVDELDFTGWDFYGDPWDGTEDHWLVTPGGDLVHSWDVERSGLERLPSIEGLSREEAELLLAEAEYEVGTISYRNHPDIPAGRVIASYPPIVADPGSRIQIVLSRGPYEWAINEGNGTPEHPYQLRTVVQLESLSEHPELWDRHFLLTGDIDLMGHTYAQALLAPNESITIGRFQGPKFTGSIDGDYHTIRHLTIYDDFNKEYLGLIGYLAKDALVQNLRVEDVHIFGASRYVAPIAGYSGGTLYRCFTSGAISGCRGEGLLTGDSSGTIEECDTVAVNVKLCIFD